MEAMEPCKRTRRLLLGPVSSQNCLELVKYNFLFLVSESGSGKAQELWEKEVMVYQNALQKHSWDVNGAFTELSVMGLVDLINKDYHYQILKNIELIKEAFEPRQFNMTPASGQESSIISRGGKENENIQTGGMEVVGFGERLVLAEEIDAVLSTEDRALVYHELRTMISNLGSQLKSFVPSLEPNRGENACVKGIQIAYDNTRLVGPEAKFKWSHFETALKVIQEMICQAPSIELANDVDYIVETKIVHGTYDYSHDESVVRFVEKVLQYTRLVRNLFSKNLQMHKELLKNKINFEIVSLEKLLEVEMTKIEEKVKFLAKSGSSADNRLALLKRAIEKVTEHKKYLEFKLSNLVAKLSQLKSDSERVEREKNDMARDQNEIEQFVHCTLDEYHRNAHKIKEILHKRLRNLDRFLVQDEERHNKELEMLKMFILCTSIQNPVSISENNMNPNLAKEE